jgi:hypothetical protein
MRAVGISGQPDVREIVTEEDAAFGFRGSPSVVVDGVDVDPRMTGTPSLQWG